MAKQKQQTEQAQEPTQEQEPQKKLTRWEAVHKAIAEVDGDTTYSDIIARAEALLKASGDADAEDHDATWNMVEKAMTHLQALGLVECDWEVTVHPLVARLGGNGK